MAAGSPVLGAVKASFSPCAQAGPPTPVLIPTPSPPGQPFQPLPLSPGCSPGSQAARSHFPSPVCGFLGLLLPQTCLVRHVLCFQPPVTGASVCSRMARIFLWADASSSPGRCCFVSGFVFFFSSLYKYRGASSVDLNIFGFFWILIWTFRRSWWKLHGTQIILQMTYNLNSHRI